MTKLKVKLFANFREITKKKEVEVDVKGSTVKDAVFSLIKAYPGLGPIMMNDQELKPYVNILLNGKTIKDQEGIASLIKSGDEIAIFPPVSGG